MKFKLKDVSVTAEWVKMPANCEPCKNCLNPIYGNRYTLVLCIVSEITKTGIDFCESCYLESLKPEQ